MSQYDREVLLDLDSGDGGQEIASSDREIDNSQISIINIHAVDNSPQQKGPAGVRGRPLAPARLLASQMPTLKAAGCTANFAWYRYPSHSPDVGLEQVNTNMRVQFIRYRRH